MKINDYTHDIYMDDFVSEINSFASNFPMTERIEKIERARLERLLLKKYCHRSTRKKRLIQRRLNRGRVIKNYIILFIFLLPTCSLIAMKNIANQKIKSATLALTNNIHTSKDNEPLTDGLNVGSGDLEESKNIMNSFSNAKTWTEKAEFVNNKDEFLSVIDRLDSPDNFNENWQTATIFYYGKSSYAVSENGNEGITKRTLAVIKENDELKVDWRCFLSHCKYSHQEILASHQEEITVRVWLTRSDYYNFEFSDEREWINFKAENSNWDESLQLYIPAKTILPAYAKGMKPFRATIKIIKPNKNKNQNQLIVTKFLGESWVGFDE